MEKEQMTALQRTLFAGGEAAMKMSGLMEGAVHAMSDAVAAFKEIVNAVAAMDTPGGQHIVYAERGAWTLHHPLNCRVPDWRGIARCPVPAAIGASTFRLTDGWSVVELDDTGLHIAGYRPMSPEEVTSLRREPAAESEPACTCEAPYDVPGVGHHPNCATNQPGSLSHEEMVEETAGYHPHTGEPDDPLGRAQSLGILPQGWGEQR